MAKSLIWASISSTSMTSTTASQVTATAILTNEFQFYSASGTCRLGDSTVSSSNIPIVTGEKISYSSETTSRVKDDVPFDLSKFYVYADAQGASWRIEYRKYDLN